MTPPALLSMGVPTQHAAYEVARRVWPDKLPENSRDANVYELREYVAIVERALEGKTKGLKPSELHAIEQAAAEVLGEWRRG